MNAKINIRVITKKYEAYLEIHFPKNRFQSPSDSRVYSDGVRVKVRQKLEKKLFSSNFIEKKNEFSALNLA